MSPYSESGDVQQSSDCPTSGAVSAASTTDAPNMPFYVSGIHCTRDALVSYRLKCGFVRTTLQRILSRAEQSPLRSCIPRGLDS